ncbi:hypothetical protein JCM5350_008035 [Sporobolomyces pararoseus]
METLSTRAERLTVKSQVKRLFYLCSLLGLVSLVGVCVVILPWHFLITQGQWVAFVFLAIIGFCWMASVAAMGQLELDLPQTVKKVSTMLTVVFLLPVLSIPLLYLLFRQTSILSISHLYSNLDNPSCSDLPPDWNVQPQSYAPDSSASDDSDEDDDRRGLRGENRLSSPRGDRNDGTGDDWFELGKREKGARRWRDVKKQFDRKGKGRA